MSTMSIGGLASGLDTTSIINSLMAIEKRPRAVLDTKQTLIQTKQSLLRNFATQLKTLQTAAADLRSATLFQQTQSVESSDPTKVSVTSTNGAGVGGYQIEVQQLANAAQRTFRYTASASDTTIRIGSHDTVIRAGATAQEVATAINTDRDAEVYAAATSDGTIVLSRRQSGADGAPGSSSPATPACSTRTERWRAPAETRSTPSTASPRDRRPTPSPTPSPASP